MKQFVKALDFHGDCFKDIGHTFPGLSKEKLKAGIFNEPQIRQLIKDSSFVASMTSKEARGWKAPTEVMKKFHRKQES